VSASTFFFLFFFTIFFGSSLIVSKLWSLTMVRGYRPDAMLEYMLLCLLSESSDETTDFELDFAEYILPLIKLTESKSNALDEAIEGRGGGAKSPKFFMICPAVGSDLRPSLK